LQALGQGALVAALPSSLWAESPDAVTISLLHTTDLHGHILPTSDYAGHGDLGGLARCAAQIRQWRRDCEHTLLLDVGDVYQGTEFGLHTRGAAMIRCLNALRYDAWVVGNHEFDWGPEPFASCVGLSEMPVLSGNARVEGKPLGLASGPLAAIRPWLVKEVAGIRVVVLSLTTPGLRSWSPPEDLVGFDVLDPVEALRGLLREVAALQPDVIVLAGHMGLTRIDDFANRVGALTTQFPQLAVFLGGHTHQNHASVVVNNVLYTQADHFGIYAGRVDLTFDRATRRLIGRTATTVHMDHTVAFDPLVLSVAQPELDLTQKILAQPVGELLEGFGVMSSFGAASDVERLIASGMMAALRQRGVAVDAVVHGLFDRQHGLAAGPLTIADFWTILPYENQIVTLELRYDDLLALAQELALALEPPNLMGLRAIVTGLSRDARVTGLCAADGSPLPAKLAYRVAFNSYDSQSGGQRYPRLGRLTGDPANGRRLHPVQVRDAVIDFVAQRRTLSRSALLV
jgi:2',3'-cyclic-nucleotide 2'-phosphodiesterase/3'-nucleotidase